MSHAMTLLKLLHERGSLSASQLVEATGLSRRQVTDALHSLRVRKAMQTGDRPYEITAVGRDLAEKREARADRRAEKTARPKLPRGPKPKPTPTRPPIPDMQVIRRIVSAPVRHDPAIIDITQRQPALQAVWGACLE